MTLAGLFFLSGISGLIYQSLWLRLLSLVFGVTIYAASTVLASFMGGLALGSVLAGRLSRRVRRPLAWFGCTEIAIGLTALTTPLALDVVARVWPTLQAALPDHLAALTVARLLCSSAVLIVPTVLMGATLPLVVRSSLSDGALVGSRVGWLYAANTSGAIAGALLAGFFLIGAVGIASSFRIAALINTVVGVSALVLSRRAPARATDVAPIEQHAAQPLANRLIPAVFAVSGFASLALEVVWFRVLVLIVAATTYAFTTMLAAVLLGIALGSAAATPLLRRPWNWTRAFGFAQIATGVTTVIAMAAYLTGYNEGWLKGSDYVASLVTILPPAFAMGLAFPMGVRAWTGTHQGHDSDSSARVAWLYAMNVGGAILGSLAAGFVLLPMLGSRVSLVALAATFVAAGTLLLWTTWSQSWRRVAAVAVILLTFGRLAVVVPSPFQAVQGRRVPPGERPFYLEEGRQTTVGVYSRPLGGRVLYLDGLHQANDSGPMVYLHRQIGLLPVAIHPAPRRALIIGLGGGVTAGAVSMADGLTLDIVELSDSVVRGAEWFKHVNANVVNRPNVRLHVDDGRNFLQATPERFDVVTADIIQPIHAGAGSLYSLEYYRLARRALAPGGVMMQWVGTRPATQYKLMVRTFLEAFPHATAWVDGTLLVGTTEPLMLDPVAFDRKVAADSTRRALGEVDITSFDALLGLYSAGPEQLRAFVGDGPLLTDDHPLVEYHRSLPENERDIDTSPLRDDVQRWVVKSSVHR
ncbi:MAG: fused MFS/spermidine synthase [Vicinamibacterales bacterium]